MTYSSPSSTAVVWMLAESDPASGSVMAMPAQTPLKRSACSSLATDAIAELPRPCRGIDSSRPTSPQHISRMESTEAMLAPFLTFVASVSGFSSRRTPAAPAPSPAPEAESPSIMAASMSSSTGYSCSRASYLRELGRNRFIATWCAWPINGLCFLGTSRLIICFSWLVGSRWLRCERGEPRNLVVVATRSTTASDQDASLHDGDGPQVAVPALHRVLLDVAVAAEQLHAV